MDVFVRRLVGRHFHITRKMGFPGAIVRSFDRVADDPTDHHMVKNSTSELWKYPKELFKLYKSATLHVVKPKIPKKVIIFGSIAVAGILFALFVLFTYGKKVQEGDIVPGVEVSTERAENLGRGGESVKKGFDDLDDYLDHVRPLSPVVPWTAPVYDEVRPVPRIPDKLACMYSEKNGCRCWTDQMTRVHLPQLVCKDIVDNGIYSPYHEPYRGGGGHGVNPPPGSDSPPPSNPVTHEKNGSAGVGVMFTPPSGG